LRQIGTFRHQQVMSSTWTSNACLTILMLVLDTASIGVSVLSVGDWSV